MIGRRTSRAMRRTDSASSFDAIGNPASMMSTPSVSSCRASWSFSSIRSENPGACSPSRNVVSKMVNRSAVMHASLTPCTWRPELQSRL